MDRRDFIRTSGSAAAMLWLPSWLLPRRQKIKSIDLGLFCDDSYGLYDTQQPFIQGVHVYATDARVAIRVDKELAANLSGDEAKLPRADMLEWPDADSAGWQPVSSLRRAAWKDAHCPDCRGRGRIGYGVEECRCEYMPTCPENGASCNGWTGGQVCCRCDGKGRVDYCLEFCGLAFNPDYVARLDTLPGVEVRRGSLLAVSTKSPRRMSVLQARFDGGVGLLCPMVRN
jgi:hypothetical protein